MAEQWDSNNSTSLDEAQLLFLENCEKEFADRYTEKDLDYKNLMESEIAEPPIMDPWYNKPKRNYNWNNERNESTSRKRRNYDDFHHKHKYQRR
ncbi:hypothetical protein PGB90_008139 [Kerria lacca]